MHKLQEVCNSSFENCCSAIPSSRLYENFDKMGLNYGPTFQVLEEVCYGQPEAVAKVRSHVPVVRGKGQEYVLHPTIIDGVLQLCFPAIFQDPKTEIPTMVPEYIQSLWISNQNNTEPDYRTLRAYARCHKKGLSTSECGLVALDDMSSNPLIVMEGLKLKVLDSLKLEKTSQPAIPKRLCYGFDWKPDFSLMSQQEIVSYCNESDQHDLPSTSSIEDLEFLCYSTMSNALKVLDDSQIEVIKPHLKQYVLWMNHEKDRYGRGELVHWRPEWLNQSQDTSYVNLIRDRVEKSNPEGKLYAETSRRLLSILKGDTDPLDILFNGTLAADYYEYVSGKVQHPLQAYIDTISHKNPQIRILEIGAGTGGITAFILENLMYNGKEAFSAVGYEQYMFTDISPGFFEKAKIRFKDHANRMEFKTLDIEKCPAEQGFQVGHYDLIVASNVIRPAGPVRCRPLICSLC